MFDINDSIYVGLKQVINRGTADILEENENGIFLRDTISDVHMLAVNDAEQGILWLKKHEKSGYSLLNVFDERLFDFAKERYQLSRILECYQAVYKKTEVPEIDGKLMIKKANETDISLILSNYDKLDEIELRKIICRRELYLGYLKNGIHIDYANTDGNESDAKVCNQSESQIVGFIGQHLEGSMGLLEILPEYRGNGYGTELECFLIREMQRKHLIPFCQVETDNEKSINLQKKLGFEISKEKVYWLY